MKKVLFSIFVLSISLATFAQTKPAKAPVKSAVKPVANVALKTLADSVGYALGVNVGSSLKMQHMTKVNTAMISRGCNDVLTNGKQLLDENAAFAILTGYSQKMQEEQSKAAIQAGQEFLAKNKLRPEIKTTATGLQYEIIKEGTGIRPAAEDTFVVHYTGTLTDGTKFESSLDRGQPLVYPMSAVIPGWTEGLQLMPIGSKYKFYIPYNLAYGLQGSPPAIPGGAALIFELELLDVKKHQ